MYEYNLIQFFVVNQKDPCDELIKFVNDKPELFWHIICHNINDYHCIIHACEHFGYNKDVTKIKIGDKYILFIAIAKDEMHVVEKLLDAGYYVTVDYPHSLHAEVKEKFKSMCYVKGGLSYAIMDLPHICDLG